MSDTLTKGFAVLSGSQAMARFDGVMDGEYATVGIPVAEDKTWIAVGIGDEFSNYDYVTIDIATARRVASALNAAADHIDGEVSHAIIE